MLLSVKGSNRLIGWSSGGGQDRRIPARSGFATGARYHSAFAFAKEQYVNDKMRVVSPEGLQLRAPGSVSRHLDSLEGKTIGEVYNTHFKGELMFRTYRRLFQERYPGVRIVPYDQFPIVYVGGDPASQKRTAKEIARIAKERGVDALISGNGG
jgi:hypothetical protein